MGLPLFFASQASDSTTVVLSESESHHALHVLRLNSGDAVQLFDGKGNLFEGVISSVSKKIAAIQTGTLIRNEPSPSALHLAVAPVKNSDRNEWLIEKATELGVGKISLLKCERSERKTVNMERLNAAALAACKQSQRLHLPHIEGMIDFKTFLEQETVAHHTKIICRQSSESMPLQSVCMQPNSVFIIGPEGDFSNEEATAAKHAGFQSVLLSDYRLRTETAAIAAVCAYHQR